MLAGENAKVEEQVDARKEKIESDAAWNLINGFETVVIGKGKKYFEYHPSEETKEEILKNALGRSGTLRAPTLKSAGKLVIGYNVDMYETFIKSKG